MERVLAAGSDRIETQHRRKDGSLVDLEVMMSLAETCSDRFPFSFLRDITLRKQTEAERERARQTALAAARIKSQFLAAMSHEIRTPMNGVLGMLGLLQTTRLDDEQREYADTAHRSGEALLTVINDILDFSKIEAGKMAFEQVAFSTAGIVEDTVHMLAAGAQAKGIDLTVDIGRDVPAGLRGDPGRLRQVLTNLIGNAIKFTERGSVTIKVSAECGAQSAETSESATLSTLRFEVIDTGIGIAAEDCARLFQAFVQADGAFNRRFGGTGLGLAISRQLVEIMGGEIGVESQPGQGSRFWFTVRLERAEPPSEVADEMQSRRRVLGRFQRFKARVLVAEDNAGNQRVVRGMLEKLGVQVEVAGNGRESVEMVRRFPFDLVLMDCEMPEMDGIEAPREIRGCESENSLESGVASRESRAVKGQSPDSKIPHPRLPVIAMTAHAMAGDREKCLEAGMDDYLSKPLNLDGLHQKLARWLSGDPPAVTDVPVQDAPPSNDPLDQAKLGELREVLGEDFPDLVQTFLNGTANYLERLRTAAGEGDIDAIARVAHGLKGSSGNIGAMSLSSLCDELVTSARRGDLENAPDWVARIEAEYAQARAALAALCQPSSISTPPAG